MLDLSYNNLEGMVPDEGIFKNSTVVSVIGNSQLCGGGDNDIGLPRCNFHQPKRLSHKLKIAIIAIAVLLALALFVTCLFLSSSRRKRREIKSSSKRNALMEEFSSRILECLNSIFRIGISCSVESPRERMKISDAVAQLYSVRNELQSTAGN
ncbi:LEUCINE RICH REPEAT FAMILY PROTEIN EXPRESSED [Salix purpurea]|uniref:LEUCINE RICH REPEAT FAMILY PROTEIN EXPRESSED n=1 Tax=Salix purpurea TaxID=77065 RepID=A0A9Q1AGG2_SALPP|nr:LEUCINE RICH REPEAT FAMILY PROTEIN EXPRESSED [Salix purpurea]